MTDLSFEKRHDHSKSDTDVVISPSWIKYYNQRTTSRKFPGDQGAIDYILRYMYHELLKEIQADDRVPVMPTFREHREDYSEFITYRMTVYARDPWEDFEESDVDPLEAYKASVYEPAHYAQDGKPELIELLRGVEFRAGNVIKYVYRAGVKNEDTELEDLLKARFYLDDIINEIKEGENNAQ